MMNTMKTLRLMLVSVILLGSLVTNTTSKKRPVEVSKFIRTWGCPPWQINVCPALMECYADYEYAYVGQCHCKQEIGRITKAPDEINTDEIFPVPRGSDCENTYKGINVLVLTFWILLLFSVIRITFMVGLTIYRVYKKGGLSLNSSSVAIVILFITLLGDFQYLAFVLIHLNLDNKMHFQSTIYHFSYSLYSAGYNLMQIECCCTWFDLYQKASSMSRKSSKFLIGLRTILRLYAVGQGLVYIYIAYIGREYTDKIPILTETNMWVMTICSIAFAPLIARVLCKDRKDVSNPNWKSAEAIRQTSWEWMLAQGLHSLSLKLFLEYQIWVDAPLYWGQTIFELWYFATAVKNYVWFKYMLFAFRRYLEDYDSVGMSSYIGLSTFGHKLTRGSFVSSSMMMSTTSSTSVGHSSSTVSSVDGNDEKKGDDTGGTIA